jgi:hypothetical protein
MAFSPRRQSATLSLAAIFCVLAACNASSAQQAAATGEPLAVLNTALAQGYLRQPYHFQLEAKGGVTPIRWRLSGGALPRGVTLSEDGSLAGTPSQFGTFTFAVSMTDSGKPVQRKIQPLKLHVVEPLLVDWNHPPRVNGQRIEGSIKVSNQTDDDFDLTTVVLAISDAGRATAIGIEHFTLKKQTLDFEIPFGDDLPFGSYRIKANIVAGVVSTNSVLKERLSAGPLQVVEIP